MITATVVIAVATVVYTFATILLFITTSRNTRITRDIFEAAHRPYIGIAEVNTTVAPNGNAVDFECAMRNFGTIPAHNVEILDASLSINGNPANLGRLEFGRFSVFPTSQHFFQVNVHNAPNANAILRFSRLELRISLRYEGLAEKKYTYGYHAVYNPIAGQFTPLKEEST
ncbi:MAG TPA: hypothetical protein VE863_17345 [Pyrinomonadaceae bacterium]|jgi:uncharacterized repeat protein (TIGR01451 family)|nr:hypothetical protein [Pyrinomonadaceae bacterium]